MNIHECVSCVGRLTSTDNYQPHSYLWPNILHVWLNICGITSILQILLNMILKEWKSER
jgi:hypothetical protein